MSKTAVPIRYETTAKSRGWFLSVLAAMSMSCAFVLLAQMIKMLRGTIAAKSVVRNVSATKDGLVALTFLTTLFAAIVPLSILIIWARRTNAHDMDIAARTDRNHPLLLAAVSYLIGTTVLLIVHAPLPTTAVMFGYFAGTFFLYFVNLRWKISIHTMGIAGPTIVLIVVFGYWGALLVLLLPPVIWSRIYLKKHTVAQALGGAAVGFLLTALALWLLLAYGPLYA